MSTTTEPWVVDNAAEERYELLVVDERAGVIEYGTRLQSRTAALVTSSGDW